MSSRRRAWLPPLLLGAAVLSVFMAFALIGNASASKGTRVLGTIDPVFSSVAAIGRKMFDWIWTHPKVIGLAVTGLAAALGLLGVLLARSRARPLLLLLTGFTLATWGQLFLWQNGPTPVGLWLYLGGIACAAVLGATFPMARLPGFPVLPSPADPADRAREAGRGLPLGEWAVIFALTLLGLLFRGYALTEHPAAFDGEMTSVMLGSYTRFGIAYYMLTEFLGTAAGVFHVFTHYALYGLLGASIFTIRLVAVFWGVVAIPLVYWLARRIAGRGAALVATVLFIAAPEQLFWSRTDNTHFAPVAVLALVTAHLGLSMQKRFAPAAVAAAALWMPFSRYSYTPSFILFTFPLLLAVHAAVFVRGAFRKLRYAAPILIGGLLLWVFSLSVVEFSLQPGQGWRFINPATVKGEAAWKHAVPKDAGLLEILRLQGTRVTKNAGLVLAGMTFHTSYTTHWYERYFAGPGRNTMISAALAVLCALGIGYLLGQPGERRAALLLIWIAIGLLPGCMSDEPEARRISIIFPALPIVAGVFVAASARVAKEAAGRALATGLTAVLAAVVLLTAFTGLASNLLLPTAPLELEAEMRFAKPLFERCDMVLHNDLDTENTVVEVGVLDVLVGHGPGRCSQLVAEKDWPAAALLPRCNFTDHVFQLTLSPREIELRRESYRPTRVGYLLRETSKSRPHIDLLRRLFPAARTSELRNPKSGDRFFTLEVPLSEIEAQRTPEVTGGPGKDAARAGEGLLQGAALVAGSSAGPGLTIRGGLLLPEQDWYRFRLEPDCPTAKLAAGTPPSDSPEARPLLAGVHPFVIRFEKTAGCRLPLRLAIEGARRPGKPVPTIFLAPRVVSATEAAAVVSVPGYGESRVFARTEDRPVDVGIDSRGTLFVLGLGQEGWKLHRFAPDGREESVTPTELPRAPYGNLSVDADGNCLLLCLSSAEVRDRSGKRVQAWDVPPGRPPTDAAWLPDGRIMICFPNHDLVEILSRDGHPEEPFVPAGEPFIAPTGVAVAPDGTILIMEESGRARLFRTPAGRWAPAPIAAFDVAYPEAPYPPDLAACAFDGTKQLLFPHRSLAAPLAYDLEGRPLMASIPGRDLSAKGLREAHGVCAARDALYVLDMSPSAVIRVARP